MRCLFTILLFLYLLPVAAQTRVGILLFDGVQIIDYTGPYEVFANAGFEVITVSAERAITTSHGMQVIPAFSLNDHPKIDIAVVPGGSVPHDLDKTDARISWIRNQHRDSTLLLGVCNGVFMLGTAGVLKGKEATTTASMLSHLEHFAAGVKVATSKRTTKSGTVFTCGGFMAGIDGALAVVRHRKGKAFAQLLANNLEYNWDPNEAYVRSLLPDILLPLYLDVNPPIRNREVLKYEGNESEWCAQYQFDYPTTLKELSERFGELGRMYQWEILGQQRDDNQEFISYRALDMHQRTWKLEALLKEVYPQKFSLDLSVSRD